MYQRVERDEEDITDSNLSYDDSEDGEAGSLGFRGLGFRGLGFRVWGLGFGV